MNNLETDSIIRKKKGQISQLFHVLFNRDRGVAE